MTGSGTTETYSVSASGTVNFIQKKNGTRIKERLTKELGKVVWRL